MLCRRHHRAVHEEGFDVPSPAAVTANPVDAVRAQNDARGVQIDSQRSMPGWQGERLDVGYAISVLHPRAGH
jgi:hypothetical protein